MLTQPIATNPENPLQPYQTKEMNFPINSQVPLNVVSDKYDTEVYDAKELDIIADTARKKFDDIRLNDPDFFGHDEYTNNRINATIGENALKGTLEVRNNIDSTTETGMWKTVDLTILNTKATDAEVEKVATNAAIEGAATVCVYPMHLDIVKRVMNEKGVTNVPPIAVVGFPSVPEPSENEKTETVWQTDQAIKNGAKEIDMVLPTSFRELGPSSDKNLYKAHYEYIKAVVDEADKSDIPVKVILETAHLNRTQIAEACILAKIAGALWVKTSTGFAQEDKMAIDKNFATHQGAKPSDVALMRHTVGDITIDNKGHERPMGVKASGKVRSSAQVLALLEAGADRIGAGDATLELARKGNEKKTTEGTGTY